MRLASDCQPSAVSRLRHLLAQLQHRLDQTDHLVMPRLDIA
jgi:hypothetical protein